MKKYIDPRKRFSWVPVTWLVFLATSTGAIWWVLTNQVDLFTLTIAYNNRGTMIAEGVQKHASTSSSEPSSALLRKTNFSDLLSLDFPNQHPHNVSVNKPTLTVYIYESLPPEFLSHNLNELLQNDRVARGDCVVELILIQLFRSFPGRTWDPEKADILVVPHPNTVYTFRYGRNFSREALRQRRDNLWQHLPYYWNSSLQSRHVFIQSGGTGLIDNGISRGAIQLTAGPSLQDGSFVVPLFADGFQPSTILARPSEWWTKPRTIAFSYFYGGQNPRMIALQGRRFRKYFRLDMEAYNQTTLGGLPYRLVPIDGNWTDEMKLDAKGAYTSSVFCMVLPGDNSWQARFFDAILNGCLPVVLTWKSSTPLGTSYFLPHHAYSIQQSYPFANRVEGGYDPGLEINYTSFVVECPGNFTNKEDVSSLRITMENLLFNRPDEIQERQLAMSKVALSLTFGLGKEAHRYEDAFATLIRTLRHHVNGLSRVA